METNRLDIGQTYYGYTVNTKSGGLRIVMDDHRVKWCHDTLGYVPEIKGGFLLFEDSEDLFLYRLAHSRDWIKRDDDD